MRLEMGTFPVNKVTFASATSYSDGLLEVSKQDLINAAREDPRVDAVDIDLAHPGESVRIWPVRDVIEPRIKISGRGQCYPGICGRPMDTVGEGVTYRLSGIGITEVSNVPWHVGAGVKLFVDMTGPWAEYLPHLSSLQLLCVMVEPAAALDVHTRNQVVHGACLRVADRIAAAVKDLEAPQTEVFDINQRYPNLPSVVYIQCVHSPQAMSGSTRTFGPSVYGFSQLHPPWFLHPNEILDGALTGPYRTAFAFSWAVQNNPLLMELYRRHLKEFNFIGVIVFRTEWTTQAEKQLMATQAAKLAKHLGAQGAVMTWDAGGNEFIEVIRTLQACENLGIKTVFMTTEDTPSPGDSTLLEPVKEADALVSTGFFKTQDLGLPLLPQMEKVIGKPMKTDGDSRETVLATGPLHAPARWDDHYGITRHSCDEF